MADLQTLREAAKNAIQAAVPRDVHVATTPGRFDLEELRRRRVPVPSIQVTVMDITTESIGDSLGVDAVVDMAAFVLVAGDRHHTADERALLLQSMLLPLVELNDWDIDVEPATDVRGRNLYTTALHKASDVVLAAVTWRQTIQLGSADTPAGQAIRDVWITYEPDEFEERETPATTQIEGRDDA